MATSYSESLETEVLARLRKVLRSRSITYAVIGGTAVWLHCDGHGRDIKDIDVLVESNTDIHQLKEDLLGPRDKWHVEQDIHFFAGQSLEGLTGI